ncbi:hypothetical protein F8M41_018243 [Gigaspora margarita]|uniref:Uncharacterized protein n=1 Tax=Gigaspora margarita TaxID=4874 RepID=A0A8H4ALR8_GIGMA|nr:hypothetical protein F8M41_018243 [Gigaspora margarita]
MKSASALIDCEVYATANAKAGPAKVYVPIVNGILEAAKAAISPTPTETTKAFIINGHITPLGTIDASNLATATKSVLYFLRVTIKEFLLKITNSLALLLSLLSLLS